MKIFKNFCMLLLISGVTAFNAQFLFGATPRPTDNGPEQAQLEAFQLEAFQLDSDDEEYCSANKQAPTDIIGDLIILQKIKQMHSLDWGVMLSPNVRYWLKYPNDYTNENDFANVYANSNNGRCLAYCILRKVDSKLIGAIEIRFNSNDGGNLGCWINEKYRCQGYNPEALFLITKLFFDLHPTSSGYTAWADEGNIAGFRSLEKFGFELIDAGSDGNGNYFVFALSQEEFQKKWLRR